MNAQPDIDAEDVTQRLAQKLGFLTAQYTIAESQRDAALRQVDELTQQVVDGQTMINDLTAQLTEANRERAAVKDQLETLADERDALADEAERRSTDHYDSMMSPPLDQPAIRQPSSPVRADRTVPECTDPACENVTKYHEPAACMIARPVRKADMTTENGFGHP